MGTAGRSVPTLLGFRTPAHVGQQGAPCRRLCHSCAALHRVACPCPAVQAEAMGHETLQHHKERVHMTGATGKRGPGPCPARPTCRAAFASCLASRLLPAFEGTPC